MAKKTEEKTKEVKCIECLDTKIGSPEGDVCGHCK